MFRLVEIITYLLHFNNVYLLKLLARILTECFFDQNECNYRTGNAISVNCLSSLFYVTDTICSTINWL